MSVRRLPGFLCHVRLHWGGSRCVLHRTEAWSQGKCCCSVFYTCCSSLIHALLLVLFRVGSVFKTGWSHGMGQARFKIRALWDWIKLHHEMFAISVESVALTHLPHFSGIGEGNNSIVSITSPQSLRRLMSNFRTEALHQMLLKFCRFKIHILSISEMVSQT